MVDVGRYDSGDSDTSSGSNRAIIALPGPSLDFGDIPDDVPIICVNLALYWAPRCDFWVSVEQPNEIHLRCEGAFADTLPMVITTEANSTSVRWQELVQSRTDICYAPFEPKWLEAAHGVANNSKLLAICFAIQNGIKDIELRGNGMSGTGYKLLPCEDMIEIPNAEKRWYHEKIKLLDMAEACEDNGIGLTWQNGEMPLGSTG